MVGRTITSVNKFKDYLVVTTSNGIFYKSFEDVMNDKIPRSERDLNINL
jgi:hypothetical protein